MDGMLMTRVFGIFISENAGRYMANPVYQMCGAAVEPAGTGGVGR